MAVDWRKVRLGALERAKSYLGVKEHPPGSNHGPQIDRWCKWANGIPGGYPWCAAFACGMFHEVGHPIKYPKQASVGFLESWAKQNGYMVKRPFKGDLVCYRFDADNWPDHMGFVEKVLAVKWFGGKFVGTIKTIEGNTSAGNDANGGQVQRRYRSASRCTFIRVGADG